jgi:hypothetical protein
MDYDDLLLQDEEVDAAAQKLGLYATAFGDVTRDYSVDKDGKPLGRLYWSKVGDAEEGWDVVPGAISFHETLQDGLKELKALSRKVVLTVFVEYADDVNLQKGMRKQMAGVLREAVLAARGKFLVSGLPVKKVVVR